MRKVMLLVAMLAMVLATAAPAFAQNNPAKEAFCHATGSETNPFVFVFVSQNSAHDRHEDDVFLGVFPNTQEGRAAAQAEFELRCGDNGETTGTPGGTTGTPGGTTGTPGGTTGTPGGTTGGEDDNGNNGDVVGDENVVTNEGGDVEYNAVCQNIIGSIGDITQNQSGQADAVSGANAEAEDEGVATADSAAVAEVAQEQGVTIAQVNNCLNDFDEDDNGFVEVDEEILVAEGSTSASASASSSASTAAEAQYSTPAEAQYSTPAAKILPETGGASLLAIGAGALLVAGGLVARRIVR